MQMFCFTPYVIFTNVLTPEIADIKQPEKSPTLAASF